MTDQPAPNSRLILALIMGALVLWGVYVAVGSYLYNLNPWRGVVVLVCVGLFLGFWGLMLWAQKRRRER